MPSQAHATARLSLLANGLMTSPRPRLPPEVSHLTTKACNYVSIRSLARSTAQSSEQKESVLLLLTRCGDVCASSGSQKQTDQCRGSY